MKSSKNYLFFRKYQIEIFAASDTDRQNESEVECMGGEFELKCTILSAQLDNAKSLLRIF